MKRIAMLVVLAVLLSGCKPEVVLGECYDSAPVEQEETVRLAGGISQPGIHRFVDDEAGVVCWIIADYGVVGISCLPALSTQLDIAP